MATSQTYVLKILLVILTIIYIVYINTQINSNAHNYYRNNMSMDVNREEVMPSNLDIEMDMQLRRDQVKKTCLKYGRKLKIPLKLYNKRLRFDKKHKLMYCENYKIGSSTWATHLLKMNNVPIYRRTPIHSVARDHFPSLLGRHKQAFLKNAESFIVARDPFERLLSSYKVWIISNVFAVIKWLQDKLNVTVRPTMVTWYSFGQVQRIIKQRYREKSRPGTIPTFREFVKYLVGELSASTLNMKKMTRMINEHWKPVYLNCGPCSESYNTILKMETFSRDNLYLKQKMNLNINVEFTRKGGREGHTTIDTTVEAFKSVGPVLIRKLYSIYKYDFELFGYSPKKYFNITK